MSVLLVDIGNTRIKWAVSRNGRLGSMRAAAHAGWSRRDYERGILGGRRPARFARILVASVAGSRVDSLFAAAMRSAADEPPEFMKTSRRAGGVTTRYSEPWRLGVDRFAGVIGAHHLVGARAACVINAGTAVTIDLVDGQGVHRGGAILPGPRLMVESLLDGTAGIGPRARGAAARRLDGRGWRGTNLFARSTRSALRQGALFAVAAAADRAVAEARAALGAAPLVLLTGGGAEWLAPLVRARHVNVPALVLRGIAVHAGLAVR